MKRGSGSEFGMSAFTANQTDFTWSFLGTNDSQVHHSFSLKRAYPRIKADDSGCRTVPLDCAPACAAAIEAAAYACSASGGGAVRLVAGEYQLNADTDAGKGQSLSGLIRLKGLADVAIVGQAGSGRFDGPSADPTATNLLIHGLHGGFKVADSVNMTFENLQIDINRMPYTYGRAKSVGGTHFSVEFNESAYPFPSDVPWLSAV
eukprot:SAG22_NODE_8176_length_677_cov_0.979239_1_plen_204_part_10